jgi:hypothetical protein
MDDPDGQMVLLGLKDGLAGLEALGDGGLAAPDP